MKIILKTLFVFTLVFFGNITFAATTYYADPNGSGSSCTVGTPCTLTQCTATASTGDTCSLNAGTYDLGSSGVNFIKNLTYTSTGAACSAILTSTNSTRVVALNPANNATPLILQNLTITGTSQNTVQVGDQAFDAETDIIGNCISGGTVRHVFNAWTRGTVQVKNNTISGTLGTTASIYQSATISGSGAKFVVTGNTITHDLSTNSAVPIIYIARNAASTLPLYAYVANNTITATAPSALGTSASIYGIRIDRVATGTAPDGSIQPAIVENNVISVTATGGTVNDTDAIMISSTDPNTRANGAIVRNNYVTCNSPVTRCISIGIDAATPSFIDNAQVYGNTVTGTYYNGVATPHGISTGLVNNAQVYRNYVVGSAAAILSGNGTNAKIYSNVVRGAPYAGLLAKGNTSATFFNNTIIMDDTVLGAKFGTYGCLEVAAQGATNTVQTNFSNNNCYVANGTGWKYVVQDSSQAGVSYNDNNYFSLVGLTTPWSLNGTGTTSLESWKFLAENTATNLNPLFTGGAYPSSQYGVRLSGASPLRAIGAHIYGNPTDYLGRYFEYTPSVGAFEAGARDFVNTRSFAL